MTQPPPGGWPERGEAVASIGSIEGNRTQERSVVVTGTISVPVVSKAGVQVGTVDVDPADFGGKISKQLLHDVVLMYLANQRAGTHHTLRRGEVAGPVTAREA